MKIVKCFGGFSMLLVLSSTAMVSDEKSSSKDVLFGKYMKCLQSVTLLPLYGREALEESYKHNCPNLPFTTFISDRVFEQTTHEHLTTKKSKSKVLKFKFKPKDRRSKYQLHHIIPLAYGGKNIGRPKSGMSNPSMALDLSESDNFSGPFKPSEISSGTTEGSSELSSSETSDLSSSCKPSETSSSSEMIGDFPGSLYQ